MASISAFSASASDTFFTGTTTSSSFGVLQDVNPASSSANSNVIDVNVKSSASSSPIDFKGTVSAVAVGNTTAYEVNFGTTSNATSTMVNGVSYTELISNGVTYAIQTTQQLNTNIGGGKTTALKGFVGGVPLGAAPEPASIATTGLALVWHFSVCVARSRANSNKFAFLSKLRGFLRAAFFFFLPSPRNHLEVLKKSTISALTIR